MSKSPMYELNNNNSFNNNNIFTFDEDDEDHDKPFQDTHQQRDNNYQHKQKQPEKPRQKPKANTQPKSHDHQIFTFDQDQDDDDQEDNISHHQEQNQDHHQHEDHQQYHQQQYHQQDHHHEQGEEDPQDPHNPPYKNSDYHNRPPKSTLRRKSFDNGQELTDLKSRILFKTTNNFVEKANTSLNSSALEIPTYSPKPEAITKRFEEKVNKLKETMKENNIAEPNFKTSLKKMPSEKNSIKSKLAQAYFRRTSNSQFKNNQEDENNFDEFKESTLEEKLRKSYEVQGAHIITGEEEEANQFEYVEEQKAIKVTNLREFLFTQLAEEYKVNALITRVEDGGFLGKLVSKTKYVVTIEENNKFLFSVTKDGMNKFVFSMNKEDCSQKNKNYLGQLLSKNFNNTDFILYDNGFDPKETKCLEYCFKQLASIQYEESSGPRKFNVVISTNSKGFHTMESEENILEKKWKEKKDRKNLAKLYSKEPQFDENDGNYKLDFKGMAGKPSVKNFVLSSDDYEDCLIFARRTNETYALEVKHPFSLIQAVAVCMSSIYHKTIL